MTDEEWDSGTDFEHLVRKVRQPESGFSRQQRHRKFRLFGCATMRTIWERLPSDSYQPAIEYIEDNAGGEVRLRPALYLLEQTLHWLDWEYSEPMMTLAGSSHRELGDEIEYGWPFPNEVNIALFRDIFGNPFRPAAFDPAWRTEHTVGLASKMYDEREFRAMPILADALEEAGCDNQDVLAHCREPGVHVRGCWVVDIVLGKS